MAEYIEREAAVMRLMQDGCSAKNVQSIMELPAVSVPQWISVKDRLPCSGQPSLVANSALRFVIIAWYDAESGCWESPTWWFRENSAEITHWMPLPEAPKGENDG